MRFLTIVSEVQQPWYSLCSLSPEAHFWKSVPLWAKPYFLPDSSVFYPFLFHTKHNQCNDHNSLKVTLIFVSVVVIGSMLLGLVAAVLCNKAFPGIRFFRHFPLHQCIQLLFHHPLCKIRNKRPPAYPWLSSRKRKVLLDYSCDFCWSGFE